MAIIHRQSDENTNQGIGYKVDTEIYPVMLWTFLIDKWKVIFFKSTLYPKIDLFSSHHFTDRYKSPCLGLISQFLTNW